MDKLLWMLIGGFFLNGCSSVELTDNDRKYGYMQVNLECGPMTEDKTSVGRPLVILLATNLQMEMALKKE